MARPARFLRSCAGWLTHRPAPDRLSYRRVHVRGPSHERPPGPLQPIGDLAELLDREHLPSSAKGARRIPPSGGCRRARAPLLVPQGCVATTLCTSARIIRALKESTPAPHGVGEVGGLEVQLGRGGRLRPAGRSRTTQPSGSTAGLRPGADHAVLIAPSRPPTRAREALRATSFFSSVAQRTELATAAQRSQSAAVSGVVRNACCRKGVYTTEI